MSDPFPDPIADGPPPRRTKIDIVIIVLFTIFGIYWISQGEYTIGISSTLIAGLVYTSAKISRISWISGYQCGFNSYDEQLREDNE